MTLEQLTHLNQKFQQKATELPDLLPIGSLVEYSSVLTRRSKRLEKIFNRLLLAEGEGALSGAMNAAEHEMDEIVYLLDRLDIANGKKKYIPITDFVKYGFEMLSYFSICCDQVLEKRMKTKSFDD
jgi:hypothetical protein